MAWWILNVSGSPGIMGLYMAVTVFPGILIGLFSGVIVDRVNKRNLLVLMDLFRGFLIAVLALLFISGQIRIWHVFLVSTAVSISSSFFNPAALTILPGIVEKDSLHKANSFMQMISGTATIAGPLLGAFAVSVISYRGAILINALSYIISGIFELFINYESEPRSKNSKLEKVSQWISNFMQDFKEGYSLIQRNVLLIQILVFIALGHFFIGTFLVSMPLIAGLSPLPEERNVYFLGLLQVAFGAGSILGAFQTSRRKELDDTMGNLKNFFLGISFASISIAGIIALQGIPVYLVLLCFPIIGYCIISASVYWRTAIQINTPNKLLGRVSSVSFLIGDASLPLSFVISGYLFSISNIPLILFGSGSILILVTFLVIRHPIKRREDALSVSKL